MKRMILLSMASIALLAVYALAQQAGDAPKPQAATPQQGATVGPQGMMTRCMGMMRKAGMDPAMMKRMQVMMQTPVFMDSPCAIYGQAANLELSDEQKTKLMEIENEARQKALAVLTPEQKKKMGDIPDKPMDMMQMRAKMMPMMQKMKGGKDGKGCKGGKGGPTMMCPMMQGTTGGGTGQGSGTKSDK
ncbi:MAG: hypothetical protein GWP05_07100 [Anaerolineaceae bacterium]|nr:hypothetical protein [Anaerolineaceae bacterium]